MPGNLTLPVNTSQGLRGTLTATGPVAAGSLTWTTSDAAVAAFTPTGAPGPITGPYCSICGLAVGVATITLIMGGFTDTLTVNVVANQVANITAVAISTA